MSLRLTAAAACLAAPLVAALAAAVTTDPATQAPVAHTGARGDDAGPAPARRVRSRAATRAAADEAPTDARRPRIALLPPVAAFAQHSAADLAILSAREWGPGTDTRPPMPPEARDAAWRELVSRGDDAFADLVQLLLHARSASDRGAARCAFVRMGACSVPVALDLLRRDDADTRKAALGLLSDLASQRDGLGSHRDAVVAALAAATDDADPGVTDGAEEVLAEVDGCLPVVAGRLARGSEMQRLSALRVLGDLAEDEDMAPVRTLLEAAARDPSQTAAVRAAAAFQLAYCSDSDVAVGSMPDPSGLPAVRLWALAIAFDEDARRADVLAALDGQREAATAFLLEAARRGREPDAIAQAIYAFRAVAADPVPLLLHVAGSAECPEARETAIEGIEELAGQGGLAEHGPEARNALFGRLSDLDEDVRGAAASALATLHAEGTDVVAGLTRALDDDAAATAAAWALSDIGSAAAGATDRLVRLAVDPSEPFTLRSAALDALASVDAAEAAIVARAHLASPSPDLRWSAAWVLLVEEADDADNRATAIACLADPDVRVRTTGARFLRRVEPSDETCAAAAAALGDPDQGVRGDLVALLCRAAPRFPVACDGFLACLRDSDPEVQRTALASQSALDACADRAVPILAALLADADEDVVALAAAAVGRLGAAARRAVPAMIASLLDRNGRPRGAVALGLGRLGEDATAARPLLADCLRRDLDTAAGHVTRALDMLGWTPAPSDVSCLARMIRGGEWGRDERMWAALGLIERAGPAAAQAAPSLVDAARSSTEGLRDRVIEVIGHVSAGEPETVAYLVEALRSGDALRYCCTASWDAPASAAAALGRIGPRAEGAVPALVEALACHAPRVRSEAAAALRAITGKSPALPRLPPDWDD